MNEIDLTKINNEWDLRKALGVVTVHGGFPYSNGECFTRSDQPGKYRLTAAAHFTWEEATKGQPYVHVGGGRGDLWNAWWPAGSVEHLDGKRVGEAKLKVTVGALPCIESVMGSDSWTPSHACGKPAIENGRCSRHAKAHAKRVEKQEQRAEAQAERDALRTRAQQADRAAREMLERESDMLEEVGLAGLTTDGSGHVTITAEALVGILRRL
jgi:hypothetical protein